MPLGDLERICQRTGFSEEEIKEIKAQRRRLKNRLSARECSSKRRQQSGAIEVENDVLQGRLAELAAENATLRLQLDTANATYQAEIARLTDTIARLTMAATAATAAAPAATAAAADTHHGYHHLHHQHLHHHHLHNLNAPYRLGEVSA